MKTIQSRQYYLIHVIDDIDPNIIGPFHSEDERDDAAIKLRADCDDDLADGLYPLDLKITDDNPKSVIDLNIGTYTGGFFSETDENDPMNDPMNQPQENK